ncbi:hypothetical protein JW916_01645 [Candidatus Sumerlaeota bacterium]|nr:hypothetical protein [Candidatus Sumerlaeota bacterium]
MLLLIVALLLVGLILIVVESFLPFGITGIVGGLIVAASAYLCIQEYGWGAGIAYLAVCAILAASVAILSFLGISRRLRLPPPEADSSANRAERNERIGARGIVTKTLNPTGYVNVLGRRCSARCEMSHIEIPRGASVVVTGTDGPYLIVNRTDKPEEI